MVGTKGWEIEMYSETGDMDLLNGKVIYEDPNGMVVEAYMIADNDQPNPSEDGDWADAEDIAAWEAEWWRYVGVRAVVRYRDAELSEHAVWSVVHGTLGNGAEVDAFDWTPSVVDGNRVTMGSNLWSVANEAVADAAQKLAELIGNDERAPGSPLWHLLRWAAPADRAEIEAAHEAALTETATP